MSPLVPSPWHSSFPSSFQFLKIGFVCTCLQEAHTPTTAQSCVQEVLLLPDSGELIQVSWNQIRLVSSPDFAIICNIIMNDVLSRQPQLDRAAAPSQAAPHSICSHQHSQKSCQIACATAAPGRLCFLLFDFCNALTQPWNSYPHPSTLWAPPIPTPSCVAHRKVNRQESLPVRRAPYQPSQLPRSFYTPR